MVFDWVAVTKQRRLPLGAKSNVEAAAVRIFNTDNYRDVCIIILCVQRFCITPVLLYAMKFVYVVGIKRQRRDRGTG